MDTKTCRKCGIEKTLDQFSNTKGLKSGKLNQCKECMKASVVVWRKANPGKCLAAKRSWSARNAQKLKRQATVRNLKKLYGITLDLFELFLEKQGRACAICGRPSRQLSRRMSVDHDHSTGEVRGLLCDKCNHLLGQANDDPQILIKAAAYLKQGGHGYVVASRSV